MWTDIKLRQSVAPLNDQGAKDIAIFGEQSSCEKVERDLVITRDSSDSPPYSFLLKGTTIFLQFWSVFGRLPLAIPKSYHSSSMPLLVEYTPYRLH